MIRSMTGYGAAAAETDALKAAVTVRSVNHRYLDLTVHLARRLQALEAEVKKAVQQRVSRGRLEVAVQVAVKDPVEDALVTAGPALPALVRTLREIQREHALGGELQIADVVRFPGAVEVAESADGLGDAQREEVLALVVRALGDLDAMRTAEGAHLAAVLDALLTGIETAAGRVETLSHEGRAARREALLEKLRALVQEMGLDEPRLYQEVVRLVDRHDVEEEVQRLRSHVAQAREALMGTGPCGKRLDFLAQELAREANTIGSKAASAGLVQEVVSLKTEVERLREQVQNVE
jgi:uncharacterized protein (TIGR00255 family)